MSLDQAEDTLDFPKAASKKRRPKKSILLIAAGVLVAILIVTGLALHRTTQSSDVRQTSNA
jgi:hypothetical protein